MSRCLQRLGDAEFPVQPVFQLEPIGHTIGQPLVVDDDQQIEIGTIALGSVRLVNPATARIAALEDDLLDPAALFPFMPCERHDVLEFLEDHFDYALQFALLVGWKMIEISAHAVLFNVFVA